MNEQELKKSVEKIVSDILEQEKQKEAAENIEKAMPTSTPANGGEDKIRSGSPMNEEEKAMEEKKKEEAKKAQEDKEEDEKKKKKEKEEKEHKMKKAADCDDDHDADDKKDKKEDKKEKKMKKSIEELSDLLTEDELELIKAWREEETAPAEEVAKSEAKTEAAPQEDLTKTLTKVIEDQIGGLKKSLDEKDTLIKSLNEKIEKIASQPAYDRRSISTLETLEKGGADGSNELSKSQVLNKMLDMQVSGKGVTSHHIAEFESTNNISDNAIRNAVYKELKIS